MNLEVPKRIRGLIDQARDVGSGMLRPIARKYDLAEHERPAELDMLGAILSGMAAGGADKGASSAGSKGRNLGTVLAFTELCWGDLGLALSIPGQGLGNAAITAVGNEEQKQRFGGKWVAMAITEPSAGSDSAAIRTTAVKDGDEYVLNGEKIFVTGGARAEALVVWASLDPDAGRAAIKSFLVEKSNPGLTQIRQDHKLGIRASDTASFMLSDCRVPAENLLGDPEISTEKSFAGAMKTFDNTRPLVAGMGVGVARAALETTKKLLEDQGLDTESDSGYAGSAAGLELQRLEAELEAARLLLMKAAWMADQGKPNALEASISKAKAGRMVVELTLKCVELCSSLGYAETELLEKWARDAKILDIFEGTQQIQQLIIARRLLGKSSTELK